MSGFSDKATPYVAGAGLYFWFVFSLAFYPATVISLDITQAMREPGITMQDPVADAQVHDEDFRLSLWYLLFMVITIISIVILYFCRRYVELVGLYIFTLWPFFGILGSLCNYEGSTPYPLSPVDWWPFW